MSDDLKPCPFCGNKTPYTDEASCRVFGNRTGHNFAVACSNCEVSAPGNRTMEGAIAEWNTRTPDPRIEALTAKLDDLQDRLNAANKARAHVMKMAVKKQAKLAKAVEALRWQADQPEAHPFMAIAARAMVADIEGEKT